MNRSKVSEIPADPATVIARVRERLDSEGRSQAWLAEQLGTSRQYVHQVLSGNRPDLAFSTVAKFLRAVGLGLAVVDRQRKNRESRKSDA